MSVSDTVVSILLRLKDEASAGVRSAGTAVDGLEKSLAGLGKSGADRAMGEVGSAAGRTSGILQEFNPEAAQSARVIADLGDVAEVGKKGFDALGFGAGASLAATGVLAAAVAGLVLWYRQLNAELEAAEAAMKKAANTASDFAAANAKVAATSDETTLAWRLATGQVTELEAAWERSDAKIRAGYADQIRLQKEKVEADKAELASLQEKIRISQENAGGGTGKHQEMVDRAAGLQARLPAAERDLAGTEERAEREIAQGRAVIAITDAKKLAAEAAAEAERRHAQAVAERAQAEAEAEAAWKSSDSYAAFLHDTSDYLSTGAATYVGEARRQTQALDEFMAGLEASAAATAAWGEETTAEMATVVAQMELLEARIAAAAEARQTQVIGGINTAAQAGGAALSGDVAGLVAMAGPAIGMAVAGPVGEAAGGAIASALNGLSALGNDGADAALAKVDSYTQGLDNAVKELPRLLDGLTSRGDELVPQITAGIAHAAPELTYALTEAAVMFPYWLSKGMLEGLVMWWAEVGGVEGLLTSFGAWARGLWAEIWATFQSWAAEIFRPGKGGGEEGGGKLRETLSSWWSGVWNGSYDVGTDVLYRDGLYMGHAGERIDRANGTTGQRASVMGGGGGSGTTIHVNVSSMLAPQGRQVEDLTGELSGALSLRGMSL